MNLFETERDLSDFLFRITDNGGESADRFTVITCDGDYYAASTNPFHPQGVGMWGERIDVQRVADQVEAGTERDLRWIDLPGEVRRAVLQSLNGGFSDWLEKFAPPAARADAKDLGYSRNTLTPDYGESVYGAPGAYMVRVETCPDDGSGVDDEGPYETIVEAVQRCLPDQYDLAGEEYHSTVNLWDETEPKPLWDRETDPPAGDDAE